ncbi:MAG: hypothetical protein JWP44_3384 [Mucilaginibacter sp.]|nr:hypothetical protein [Mucilaginibacter sp.]
MFTGFLAALVFPAIALITAYLLKYDTAIVSRPGLPYFIAIALNLIIMRFALKQGLDKTGKGVMLATFIVMVLVFAFKIHPIR